MTSTDPFPLSLPSGTRAVGREPYGRPGEIVRWRFRRIDFDRFGGEIVQPMRVVREDERGLVLWLAGDTPTAESRLRGFEALTARQVPDGIRFAHADRALARVQVPSRWYGGGVLRIVPAEMPFSVWVFHSDDGRFRGWYVNLEHEHRRLGTTELFTSDHILDLTISPAGVIRRKDEDELAGALEHGMWDAEAVARIEANAELAVAAFESGHWAFDAEWTTWLPDPAWPVPGAEHLDGFLPPTPSGGSGAVGRVGCVGRVGRGAPAD
ncbi:DUF402 domain-containing protein [Brevibacterium daeguense]|uniref:DUF402 domain-containing protein n=1 Tax=Brevibacterium daeguense TaxID=909936 RepID=A0ABP8EKC6_9MICO|nr:DUF402 domain-containing protein [Brevibacterium daeguense]